MSYTDADERIERQNHSYQEKYGSVYGNYATTRAAFSSFLLLPDGRTTTEVTIPELAEAWPRLLTSPHLAEEKS